MIVRPILHRSDPYVGFFPSTPKISGWGSDNPVFKQLIDEVRPSLIAEVGTWLGASAIHMASLCDAEIVCVDTWLGSLEMWNNLNDPERHGQLALRNGYPQIYRQFLSNVVHSGKQEQITPCPMPSLIAARLFREKKVFFDLCYIDASHDEDDVLADISAWMHVVRPGGVMFGDDLDWESVERAVRRCPFKAEISGRYWIIRS